MRRQPFFVLTLVAAAIAAAPHISVGQAPVIPPTVLGAPGAVRIMPGSAIPSTIPFSLWNGIIMAPAVVGDGVPIPAAINTGLPLSVLTPQLAARQGIKPGTTKEIELLDRKITVLSAPAQTVRFEGMALAGVPFAICDILGQLSSKETAGPAIWLGSSAFEGLCITIDPQKSEMVIKPSTAAFGGKGARVPFALRDGRIWVDVVANDKQKFEALIDTGSVATMVPPKVATALQLKAESSFELVDKNGKPGKVGLAKLDQATLGKLLVKDVPVLFVAEGDPQGINQDFAVLGNDFLFRYRVTIDFGRKEVSFEPLTGEKPKREETKKPVKEEKKEQPAALAEAKPASKDPKKPDDAKKPGEKKPDVVKSPVPDPNDPPASR
jgi:hypothetical protein